jgi:hypothetical protein
VPAGHDLPAARGGGHRLAVLALGHHHAIWKDQQDREGRAGGRLSAPGSPDVPTGRRGTLSLYSTPFACLATGKFLPRIFKLSFVVLPGGVCIVLSVAWT